MPALKRTAATTIEAIAVDSDGTPQVVIDWKSDVEWAPETIQQYRAQLQAYLDMTGVERGLLVAVTTGQVFTVQRTSPSAAT